MQILQDKNIFQKKERKRNSKSAIEKKSPYSSIKSTVKGYLYKRATTDTKEKNINKPKSQAKSQLEPSLDKSSSSQSISDQPKREANNNSKIQMDAVETNESAKGHLVHVNEDRKGKIRNSMDIVNRVKRIMYENAVKEENQRKLRQIQKTLRSKRGYPSNNSDL